MPTTRPNEGSFAGLAQVQDQATKAALQVLMSLVTGLKNNPRINGDADYRGNRITAVGDPVDPQDVVTKAYLDENFSAGALRIQLQAGGSTPLSLTGLPGVGNSVTFGTHAERLATPPDPDVVFFAETDRWAIYYNTGGSWVLLGNFTGFPLALAARPADLSTADAGFYFWAKDQNDVVYRFSGNIWHYHSGTLIDNYANLPDPALTDNGFYFVAKDQGYKRFVMDNLTGGWLDLGPINKFGSVTISGAVATTVAVTGLGFPDSAYSAVATVTNQTGVVPAGALNVYISAKGNNGFTINIQVASGLGNSVTIDWIVAR